MNPFLAPLALFAFSTVPLDQVELTVGRAMDMEQPLLYADELHPGGEVTYNFRAVAGQTYQIETHLGGLTDSVLELRGPDNATVLAVDDDGGAGLASRIVWTAQASEVLHISVRGYSRVNQGLFAVGVTGAPMLGCTALWPCEIEESIPEGGERWYAFYAHDNLNNGLDASYRLATQLGTLSDTTMTLVGADGVTPLAYNDDIAPPERHSEIRHVVARGSAGPRLRFVKVAGYSPLQAGSFTFLIASNDAPADYACLETCEEAEEGIDNWLACVAEECSR